MAEKHTMPASRKVSGGNKQLYHILFWVVNEQSTPEHSSLYLWAVN